MTASKADGSVRRMRRAVRRVIGSVPNSTDTGSGLGLAARSDLLTPRPVARQLPKMSYRHDLDLVRALAVDQRIMKTPYKEATRAADARPAMWSLEDECERRFEASTKSLGAATIPLAKPRHHVVTWLCGHPTGVDFVDPTRDLRFPLGAELAARGVLPKCLEDLGLFGRVELERLAEHLFRASHTP